VCVRVRERVRERERPCRGGSQPPQPPCCGDLDPDLDPDLSCLLSGLFRPSSGPALVSANGQHSLKARYTPCESSKSRNNSELSAGSKRAFGLIFFCYISLRV